jgi:hypothetical protein
MPGGSTGGAYFTALVEDPACNERENLARTVSASPPLSIRSSVRLKARTANRLCQPSQDRRVLVTSIMKAVSPLLLTPTCSPLNQTSAK